MILHQTERADESYQFDATWQKLDGQPERAIVTPLVDSQGLQTLTESFAIINASGSVIYNYGPNTYVQGWYSFTDVEDEKGEEYIFPTPENRAFTRKFSRVNPPGHVERSTGTNPFIRSGYRQSHALHAGRGTGSKSNQPDRRISLPQRWLPDPLNPTGL